MRKRNFKKVIKELENFIGRKLSKDEKRWSKIFFKCGYIK